MCASSVFHLLIPGLLGPFPPELLKHHFLQLRLPSLERIMARALNDPIPSQSLHEKLRKLFHIQPGEFPAGALGWLGEGHDPGSANWMRADPVHLQPDRDQLVLLDASALELEMEEAQQLISACNQLLQEDGLELIAAAPERWYLRSDDPICLHTTPIFTVTGRALRHYMPKGEDSGRWLALMTELQMLLHQLQQNSMREAEGKLSVNSVWFWGAGALPEKTSCDWQSLYADEPVARGLGKHAGIAVQHVPDSTLVLTAAARSLMVLTRLTDALQVGDLLRWNQALERFEQQLFLPLLQRVESGELSCLIIETEGERFTLNRSSLRRFWRRSRPLQHYLES